MKQSLFILGIVASAMIPLTISAFSNMSDASLRNVWMIWIGTAIIYFGFLHEKVMRFLLDKKVHKKVVKFLLKNVAYVFVNTKDNDGITRLWIASQQGHTEVVKLLLKKGADVNTKDKDGITALVIALRNGHAEIVKLLLEKGADVNAKDYEGFTALWMTLERGHTKGVKLLLEKGGVMENLAFFESKAPLGNGLCSDNSCPCPQVVIPHGTGYLYIEQSLVDFRRLYPTEESADRAMREKHAKQRASLRRMGMGDVIGFYTTAPILVCERGAKLRNIDLDIAAADAKCWWETGQVPLRATPLAEGEIL